VGEIGLDRVKEYSPLRVQRDVLHRQLAMAKECGKPVIFHSRGGEEEVLQAAVSAGIQKAAFHCYTGSWETAKKILDRGHYLSFAGFVTFPKGMPDWMGQVPLDRVLIETDCPYLAPVPYRGKRNEPAYVGHAAEAIARRVGKPLEEVAKATAENAVRLFGITAAQSKQA
jgi:TatD DNase family protein